MTVLPSYVGGRWIRPDDAGAPVRDAVTGDQVAGISTAGISTAGISTAGIDMRSALGHARTVGGPVLREPTFHERAALPDHLERNEVDEGYLLTRQALPTSDRVTVDYGA